MARWVPMSPAKRAKSKGKPARKAARPAKKAAKPAKSAKAGAKPSKAAAAKTMAPGHAHCAATDPFGDPCQNVPRRPSRYCVIHSYLER